MHKEKFISMKDSTLIKLSLAWSLIGIFVLILIASFAKPDVIKIKELEANIGKTVAVQGEVIKADYKDKVSFIDLKDETGKTTVVLFENPKNKVEKMDVIAVKGKVQVYKGDLELIAEEIICVSCD